MFYKVKQGCQPLRESYLAECSLAPTLLIKTGEKSQGGPSGKKSAKGALKTGAVCSIRPRVNGLDWGEISSADRHGDILNVPEDKFVIAEDGKTINMEDMSGCTGVFAWDKDHKLAAQHAFSGSEKEHVTKFAGELDKANFTPEHFAIAANSAERYNAAAEVLTKKYYLNVNKQLTSHYYEENPTHELERHRFTATSGDPNRHVKGDRYIAEAKEPGDPPGKVWNDRSGCYVDVW